MVHKEAKRCFRNGGSDFSLPLEVDTSLNGAGFRRQKVNLISLFSHVTLPPSAVRDGFILIFLHPFVTLWRLANRRQSFSGSRAGWGMVIDFPLHLLHLAWQFEMAHAKHIITPSDIVSQTDCPLCVDIVIISWCSAFACRKKCVTRKHLFLLSKKTSAFPISYRREVFFFLFLSSKQEHALLLFLSHCLSYGLDWTSSCCLAPRATRRRHRARAPQIREPKVYCSNEQLGNCFGRCYSRFYPLFGAVEAISSPCLTDYSLRPFWLLNNTFFSHQNQILLIFFYLFCFPPESW